MKPVAVVQEKGEWAEFLGQNRIKSGWIRSSAITTDPADIAIAVLAVKKKITPKSEPAKLKAFVESAPYPESIFIKKLNDVLAAQPVVDSAASAQTTDNPAPADQPATDTASQE